MNATFEELIGFAHAVKVAVLESVGYDYDDMLEARCEAADYAAQVVCEKYGARDAGGTAKPITKTGPQLTAAQAIDFILQTLDNWRREADKKINLLSDKTDLVLLGKSLAYDAAYDFIETLRDEKFDDAKTENPITVVADSRSYETT